MRRVKYVFKFIKSIWLLFFGFIVLYLLTAWICSNISTRPDNLMGDKLYEVYAASNGVHTDVIIPIELLDDSFKSLEYKINPKYIGFGWGDKGFYLHTPTWEDLSFSIAVSAIFLESPTAMHVTEYPETKNDWKKVEIDNFQLKDLLNFIQDSFRLNSERRFMKITSYSYGNNDTFYEAKGSYSCLRTCNTWTNEAMKKASVTTAIWTPFDWGVLKHL